MYAKVMYAYTKCCLLVADHRTKTGEKKLEEGVLLPHAWHDLCYCAVAVPTGGCGVDRSPDVGAGDEVGNGDTDDEAWDGAGRGNKAAGLG